MSFTHASTDLNFNFAAVNQVSGPLGKQKFTSTGSKGQVKRSRLSVVIGRFRSISFVFVSAGILIPRYLWAVDKTRNTEHSGKCRNIPEHPGKSRNMKK